MSTQFERSNRNLTLQIRLYFVFTFFLSVLKIHNVKRRMEETKSYIYNNLVHVITDRPEIHTLLNSKF